MGMATEIKVYLDMSCERGVEVRRGKQNWSMCC